VVQFNSSINTMVRIVSPLILGDIYRQSGAALTFGIVSTTVFTSSAIELIRRFLVVRGQRKMADEGRYCSREDNDKRDLVERNCSSIDLCYKKTEIDSFLINH